MEDTCNTQHGPLGALRRERIEERGNGQKIMAENF